MTWPPEHWTEDALTARARSREVWERLTGTYTPGNWVERLYETGAGHEFAETVGTLARHAVSVGAAIAGDADRAKPKTPASAEAATPEGLTSSLMLATAVSTSGPARRVGADSLLGWLTVLASDLNRDRSAALRRDVGGGKAEVTGYPMGHAAWAPLAYAAGLTADEVLSIWPRTPDLDGLQTMAALRGYILPAASLSPVTP